MHAAPTCQVDAPASGFWRTLRFRLAVWNAAVVIVTALVTLAGLRQGVQWALVHELDQVLLDDAREVTLAIDREAGADPTELREELARMAEGHQHHGWYVKLYDEAGAVIWSSPEAPVEGPPLDARREPTPRYFAGRRVVDQRISQSSAIKSIRIGATLKLIEQDMARIDRGVFLAAGAASLAAPLCGYWLASRAARTVGEIISTAARLRPAHLDERLPIRGSGDELDQLATTVNSLLDRIATYLNTKRDFLANAAHELRTPLAAIRSSVEVALNGDRSIEEYEDLMVDVIGQCMALETLVNQLLLLSETEADLPAAKFEPVDLQVLTAKAIDMFSGVAEAGGVTLRAGRLEPARVTGNPQHLRQLLNNLIDNAVKYGEAGGEVVVDLAADQVARQAQLRVRDNGPGMTPEEQRHIFERFYRAESARTRARGVGGTGLGLSICQSVVQNHGGSISCTSAAGRGAVFTVVLPLRAE